MVHYNVKLYLRVQYQARHKLGNTTCVYMKRTERQLCGR
jgi:hypothetical protein